MWRFVRLEKWPDWQLLWCFQVIILIGNKADLEAQRDVTYEEAKQFAEENGEKCFCVFVTLNVSKIFK